jgi:superfamily II DNA/RNA helicase
VADAEASSRFVALDVSPDLVAALGKQEIFEPTAIQVAALPVLRAGKDAYLHAETGTGKTLAYLLPLFERIDPQLAATQLAIVAPTHELSIQIQRQCTDLAQNSGRALRILLLIGGTSMDRQVEKLKKKPHVVVGSPGRIRELIGKGKLKAAHLRAIVVDEADRLLHEESLPALKAILQAAPRDRQLVFASATQDQKTRDTIAGFAPDLVMLEAGETAVNANIEHLYVVCEERDKPDVLRKLLHALKPERAMIFADRADTAELVAARLAHHKIPTADLSAAMDKLDRKRAMDEFRSGAVPVLLASDVAARGLDIKGISHVFNLDVPAQSKAYLHRVGRTARAGAAGQAVTLVTPGEQRLIRRYRNQLGIALTRVEVSGGRVLADDDSDWSDETG